MSNDVCKCKDLIYLLETTGPQGLTGMNEIDGIDGADGIDGIDSVDGIDGIDSIVGPQGPINASVEELINNYISFWY